MATTHDPTAGLIGLRAAAQPPSSPKSANPARVTSGRPCAAKRPSTPPRAIDTMMIPAVRRLFWLVPKVSMLNLTTSPGV